jgi:hypothetical protein
MLTGKIQRSTTLIYRNLKQTGEKRFLFLRASHNRSYKIMQERGIGIQVKGVLMSSCEEKLNFYILEIGFLGSKFHRRFLA